MDSRINRVDIWTLRIPLPHVVWLGEIRIAFREYAVAIIETSDGTRGWGYTLTRGAPIETVARHCFVPLLENEDASEIERLSQKMFDAAFMYGADGIAARAISILDIALWDLRARRAGLPLAKLLAPPATEVPSTLPILVPCGYRRENDDGYSLTKELGFYRDAGVRALKTMLFPQQAEEQAKELAAARQMLGDDIVFGNDFFARANDNASLLEVMHALHDVRLDFIEDPFPIANREAFRDFRESWPGKIVTGETVSNPTIARDLVESGSVTAVRWDATVCGGITAWLRMQDMTAKFGMPVWPHVMPDLHLHLAAAMGQPYVEMPLPAFDTMGFNAVLNEPLEVSNGQCYLPTGAGLGVDFDEDRASEFRLMLWITKS